VKDGGARAGQKWTGLHANLGTARTPFLAGRPFAIRLTEQARHGQAGNLSVDPSGERSFTFLLAAPLGFKRERGNERHRLAALPRPARDPLCDRFADGPWRRALLLATVSPCGHGLRSVF
jgi:hypothetical protein